MTRTIKVAAAPDWIDFHGAQAAQVRRTVTTDGKKSVEVVYLITSADPASAPATLAAWVRSHWGIKNRLHYVRDVTFGRTSPRYAPGRRPGRGHPAPYAQPAQPARLFRLAGWDNIAKALRHHARDPERALTCLLIC